VAKRDFFALLVQANVAGQLSLPFTTLLIVAELGLPFTTLARMDFLTKSLFVAEFNLPFTNLAEMDFLALSMHTDATRQKSLVRVTILRMILLVVVQMLQRAGQMFILGSPRVLMFTRGPSLHPAEVRFRARGCVFPRVLPRLSLGGDRTDFLVRKARLIVESQCFFFLLPAPGSLMTERTFCVLMAAVELLLNELKALFTTVKLHLTLLDILLCATTAGSRRQQFLLAVVTVLPRALAGTGSDLAHHQFFLCLPLLDRKKKPTCFLSGTWM